MPASQLHLTPKWSLPYALFEWQKKQRAPGFSRERSISWSCFRDSGRGSLLATFDENAVQTGSGNRFLQLRMIGIYSLRLFSERQVNDEMFIRRDLFLPGCRRV